MNKITQLLNEDYVIDFFRKKVLPKYPEFSDIQNIDIKPHKKNIWDHAYHIVFEFVVDFEKKDGSKTTVSIFCSGHSQEPRRNVHRALRYLWSQDFSSNNLTIPRALFYDNNFKAVFYEGVNGINLYKLIRQKDYKEIEAVIPKAAQWFSKLHNLPTVNTPNFNPQNSRIKTVVPGSGHILKRIKENYSEYYNFFRKVYSFLIKKEEEFLDKRKKLWLVHGDAHPENIIMLDSFDMTQKKVNIAVIDFTDLSLSDFARDLGTFFQQVDYMVGRKIGKPEYAEKIKNIFLKKYLKYSKIKMSKALEQRINNYYNWTAMRTATFLLMRDAANLGKAEVLFAGVKERMKI